MAKCAQIAATANNISSEAVVKMLIETCRHSAWNSTLEPMLKSLKSNVSTQEFASNIGLQNGVTGYIVHSVPVAIYAWLRHPENARQALTEIISAGGDSDSTAAVTAALVGCRVGEENFPSQWRTGIADWPLTLVLLRSAAKAALADTPPPSLPVSFMLIRNLVTLPIIVAHVFKHWRPW